MASWIFGTTTSVNGLPTMVTCVISISALVGLVSVVTTGGVYGQTATPMMGPAGGSDPLDLPSETKQEVPAKLDSEEAFLGMCGLAQGLANAVDQHYSMWNRSIESTYDHNCTLAIEMIYIARQHIKEAITQIQQNFTANNKAFPDDTSGNKAAWVSEAVSISASYATASTHITAGVFNRKGKCLPQELRLLYQAFIFFSRFMVTQRRARNLAMSELKQLWLEYQGTPRDAKLGASAWINEALSLFEGDARTMQSLIETRGQPEGPIYNYREADAEGIMNVMEGLRQDAFEDWPMDLPILQGILKYGTKAGSSIADFGSASGFVTRWFNKTGLVHAQAYDAIPGVHMSSAGAVQYANLTAPQFMQRFDWVTAFNVLDILPTEQRRHNFLENVGRHAREGAVITWLSEPAPFEESAIESFTGLKVDEKFTKYLRKISDIYGDRVVVLRRDESVNPWISDAEHTAAGVAQARKDKDEYDRREEEACNTGRHLPETVYRGHDLEMLEEVSDARDCCARCWTYGKYWTYSEEAQTCYLKSWKDKIMEGRAGYTSGHYWVHGDPYDERLKDDSSANSEL